jgi:Ni/Co efflux regulator RcnB
MNEDHPASPSRRAQEQTERQHLPDAAKFSRGDRMTSYVRRSPDVSDCSIQEG